MEAGPLTGMTKCYVVVGDSYRVTTSELPSRAAPNSRPLKGSASGMTDAWVRDLAHREEEEQQHRDGLCGTAPRRTNSF